MKCIVIISTLLSSSTCTQDQENDKLTVVGNPETLKLKTVKQKSVYENKGKHPVRQQKSSSVVDTDPQESPDDILYVVAERYAELKVQFSNDDRNRDGYLELHEFTPSRIG